MSAKRKDGFSEAIVGVFMLAVLALLVYFTIIISGVDVIHGKTKVYAAVTFTDVGGLKDKDNVMYRGTKVGVVDRIELSPDALKVIVEIDKGVVMREGYRISVCDLSMLGGHYLLMEEGEGAELDLVTTEFRGETPVDFGRTISHAAKKIDEIFSSGKLTNIVDRVEVASANLAAMTEDIRAGKGTVGRLLSEDEPLYSDIRSTVSDAKTTMTNLAAVTTNLREGRGTVGKLLSEDETVYNDLRKTLDGAAAVAEKLKGGEGLAGRLLAKDDPLAKEFEDALNAFRRASESFDARTTLASAEKLMDNLNAVAERLRNGEGTLGRLMADDGLYKEVDGLARDVRQVIDNFRDTTPISTFGSLIMGGL